MLPSNISMYRFSIYWMSIQENPKLRNKNLFRNLQSNDPYIFRVNKQTLLCMKFYFLQFAIRSYLMLKILFLTSTPLNNFHRYNKLRQSPFPVDLESVSSFMGIQPPFPISKVGRKRIYSEWLVQSDYHRTIIRIHSIVTPVE